MWAQKELCSIKNDPITSVTMGATVPKTVMVAAEYIFISLPMLAVLALAASEASVVLDVRLDHPLLIGRPARTPYCIS